jgi:hypothetical protein
MSTERIVEAIDVFENGDFDLPAGLPISALDHLNLEGFKEAFYGSVIIAVSFSAHRCCQAVFSQDFLVSCEQYWLPRSVWRMQPLGGRRRAMAMLRARIAKSFFIRLLMAHLLRGRDLRANHAGRSHGGNDSFRFKASSAAVARKRKDPTNVLTPA